MMAVALVKVAQTNCGREGEQSHVLLPLMFATGSSSAHRVHDCSVWCFTELSVGKYCVLQLERNY